MVNNTMSTMGIGTHYPNRIFVGSLPGSASANDLAEFFKKFGTVLEGKVVLDCNGNSRRFGFITFATNDDVKRVLGHGVIFFRGKQINVGPAVKRLMSDGQPSVVFSPVDGVINNNGQCNRSQICELHPFADPLTPPMSPASPMSGQRVFFRMDQVQSKTAVPPPNVHLPVAQPCVISCAGISLQPNVTSLHLPCQSLSPSQLVPQQRQVYHPSRYSPSTSVKQAITFQNWGQTFATPSTTFSTHFATRTASVHR